MKFLSAVNGRFGNFLQGQGGSAMPLVALGMFMLVGATGMAIDMGRVQIVQTRMQNALDAAGLAAGATVSTTNLNTTVSQYFYANFPANYLGTTVTSLTATPNSDDSIINLASAGTVNTTFMNIFGIHTMSVSASSQITRQSSGMELVLVLDNTGSMNNPVNPADSTTPKITALQNAATTLLNTLYGSSNNTVSNLWVGIVPFTQTVNIGTSYPTWMNTSYNSALDFGPVINGSCPSYKAKAGTYSSAPSCAYTLSSTPNFGPGNWQGCVMARTAPYDTSDDPPSTSLFQAYNFPYTNDTVTPGGPYNYNPWMKTTTSHGSTTYTYNYGYNSTLANSQGPNAECPQPVTPMVAEKSTLITAINSLKAGGDTAIDLGMAWGWRMLSPRWQGLWGGEMNANQLPLAYNTPLMNKVVILMTDGMNHYLPGNYTAYGYLGNAQLGTTNETTAENALNSRTAAICSSLKANGVIIYTIGFGTTDNNDPTNPTSVNGPLLQGCASQPAYYFLAPTNAQLQSAFQQIGDSLANLRISQ